VAKSAPRNWRNPIPAPANKGRNMSGEIPPLPKCRPDIFTSTYRVLTLLLLAGIGLILFFGLFHKSSLSPECQAAIAKANTFIASNNSNWIELLSSDFKNYTLQAATKTIDEQILFPNEYEFTALRIIALQNTALLDITINCH
jgi:hypothetical protein